MPLRSDHTVAFFGLLGGVDKFVNIPNRRRYELRTLKACDIGNVKGYCKKYTVEFLYACKTCLTSIQKLVCLTLRLFCFCLYSVFYLYFDSILNCIYISIVFIICTYLKAGLASRSCSPNSLITKAAAAHFPTEINRKLIS